MRKGYFEKLLLFAFILVFFLCMGFAGRWFYMVDMQAVIRPGVSIEGIDVGGMSIWEAKYITEDWVKSVSDDPLVTVSSQNMMSTLSQGQGFTFNVDDAVKNAYNIGRKGNFARNFIETLMTKAFKENIAIDYSLNPDGIIKFATEYSNNFYKEGENAQLLGATLTEEGEIKIDLLPAVFAQSVESIQIYNACIITYETQGLNSTVDISPRFVPPPITDDIILNMANQNIQFGYTPTDISIAYREINSIKQSLGAIVLFPNESFSLKNKLEKNPDSIYNSINLPTIIMGAGLRAGLTAIEKTSIITDLPIGDGQSVIIGENSDLKLVNNTKMPVIIWIGGDPNHIYANASCFYEEGISFCQIASVQKGNDYSASSVEVWRVYYSDTSRERYRELLWEQNIA